MPTLDSILDDLVAGNRILAGLGVLDGFGHLSARHPDRPDRFLLSRSLAPELVTRDDIQTYDLASTVQDGDARAPYVERFIHGEIYAQRPDVHAVVHSHAATVVPFGTTKVALRPIFHMSSFLRSGAPVFEMRQRFGNTDMLVRNNAQGAALAEVLGKRSVVLMRGHGYCVVADTIPVAVFRAYYTQANAELQQRAIALGGDDVTYLTEEEAALSEKSNEAVIGRPWGLWKAKFAPQGAVVKKVNLIVLFVLLSAAALAAATHAIAQTYPAKPIRLVVPFAPGGASDLTARTLAQKMGESMGQPIVVDNKPGANGAIGTDSVAKSRARRLHDPAHGSRLARGQSAACTRACRTTRRRTSATSASQRTGPTCWS